MPASTGAPADAFLSTLERDLRSPPPPTGSRGSRRDSHRDRDRDGHRDRDRDRDRDRYAHAHARDHERSSRRSNRRRDDEDADDDKYRSSAGGAGGGRMRGYDDDAGGGGGEGGYEARKRRYDRDHSPRSSRRRRDDDEDEYYASRRNDDPYRSSRRRDPYDDGYDAYGPPSRRGGGHYDDPYGGGGGGGGGWRDGPREPSPAKMRSPTPEGTRPISQRRRNDSKWDIRPPGFEDVSAAQAKTTGLFGVPGQSRTLGVPGAVIGRDSTGQAVIPEALPPIRFGGLDTPPVAGGGMAGTGSPAPQAQQVGGGMTSANRQSRRLYIGNVGHGTNEQNFVAFWNERMKEMKFNLADGDACISSQVNTDKGYAFVEFRCPEEATNAMSFDGIIWQNQALKIRRPKDYTGPDITPRPIHVPGVISTNVPDGPNKIYIGGLPTYLNEDQIIELLKAFGEVRAFNLVREANNGPSKGFAFCEYVDSALTDLACQGLNDMELGDRKLVVQRASAGQRGQQPQGGHGGYGGGHGATGANAGPLGAPRGGGGGAAAHAHHHHHHLPPAPASGAGEPTRAMTMLNMVTPEELVDDAEYGEIVEDIRDECAKYGHVTDVRIPRPVAQSKGASAQVWSAGGGGGGGGSDGAGSSTGGQPHREREGVGRVYVRFSEVSECSAALRAIAGRQFGGRLVICGFLKEEDWPADEDGGENAEVTARQASGPRPRPGEGADAE